MENFRFWILDFGLLSFTTETIVRGQQTFRIPNSELRIPLHQKIMALNRAVLANALSPQMLKQK